VKPAAILIKDPAGLAVEIQYDGVTDLPDGHIALYAHLQTEQPQWQEGHPESGQCLVYCSATGNVGLAEWDGEWLVPEPQDIESEYITHWQPKPTRP
jgi:hypothetical protein